MDILEIQSEMMAGKEVRIWFRDGSSCLAEYIEDLSATADTAERFEVLEHDRKPGDRMRVAIIDADLIGRERHRFPNLASEKLSAYWKEQGALVDLKLDYNGLDEYDQVFISKVFTDTPFPKEIKETDRIHLGGTGFFFDMAPNLPDEIEHHMPDYHLYDGWINREMARIKADCKRRGKEFRESYYLGQFKEYLEYSIGFLTRGCFRKCGFCVNKKYDHVFEHSPLSEFYDPERRKICLLDDNFFGYGKGWKPLLEELIDTGRQFKFKQGLDERLLTDEKSEMLFTSNYDSDYTFAFDNISDYDLIQKKLEMIRKYTKTNYIRFYVLVGFESTDAKDIENAFKRIELLIRYKCIPYIMRYAGKDYAPWKDSEYKGMYITLARWCNQVSLFKKLSLREFAQKQQEMSRSDKPCAPLRYITEFEQKHPDIAAKYYDMCWRDTVL